MLGPVLERLHDEARRIWCYRWLALGVSTAVLAVAAAYAFGAPSTYETWGQIYVNRQTSLAAAAEGVSLSSDNAAGPYVVQKTLLNEDSLAAVAGSLEPGGAGRSKAAAIADRLRGHIKISDQGDGFVEIHYTDSDPERAELVVRLLLTQFISGMVQRAQKEIARASAFLDEQIASYDGMLAESQAKLAAFRHRAPTVAEPDEAAAPEPVVAQAAPAAPVAPPPSAADQRVSQLEAKLASLLTTYTDQYPDVVATRRQLAEARTARDEELAAAPAATTLAPTRTAAPRLRLWRSRPRPATLSPEAAAALAELQHKDELLRANYQQLLAKRAAVQMAQAVYTADRAGKYQITREPTVPTAPVGPNRKLYLLAGAAAALCAGLGAAYLAAAVRGVLVSAREIEEVIQLPVIGAVSWEPAWLTRSQGAAEFGPASPTGSRSGATLRLDMRMENAR